ncbi:MAG TPA: POTRA domain-containing protein [Anaeromyxobacter sp.]|nr:POTRA domain-containing protein [Anaeromyxobacter sp.]
MRLPLPWGGRLPTGLPALLALCLLALWPFTSRGLEEGEGEEVRVSGVRFLLPPGEDQAALSALFPIGPRDPLSRRALRTAVQRLHQTGRFRNVRIRTRPVPPPPGESGEWVELWVEAEAQRRLARVNVRTEGPAVLSDEALRDAIRLTAGDPFEPADLDAAAARIRAALARKGYRDPQVEVAVRGEAAKVLEVLLRRGPPTVVRSVRAEGDAGPAASLLGGIASRPGAVLDQDALSDDVRALRSALHAAGYRRAQVTTASVEEGEGGADVVFPVNAGPKMALVFRGNETLPRALLEKHMGLEPEATLDATALEAAADRLRAAYRARGFAAAEVEVEEKPRGRELLVLFRIWEGRPLRLTAVRFEGTEAHPPGWLKGRLDARLAAGEGKVEASDGDAARQLAAAFPSVRQRAGVPDPLPAGEYYEEVSWDRAAEELADELRGEGYLEAIYLGTQLDLDEAKGTAEVVIRLREGARTTVESVSLVGNEVLGDDELLPLVRLGKGDGLAYARVEEARAALLRRYGAKGRVFARVEVREQMDRERHTVALRFEIEEGPEVRVGRILVSGNRRTRTELVRNSLLLHEGEVYDPESAARSQTALLDTGVFRAVNVRLQDPDAPQPTKDLLVEVTERPYAILTQSIGFSIAQGPRAMLEYERPNLFGRALDLALLGKVNYPTNAFGLRPDLADKKPEDRVEGQLNAGLRNARLLVSPFPTAGQVNLIGEVVHRPAYNMRRVSGVTGVDLRMGRRATFSLQYEVEVDEIARTGAVGQLTEVDVERLRFDEGTTTLQALRPSLVLDFRDDPTHPEHGWLASGSVEYEHSLGKPGTRIMGVLPGSAIHTNLAKAWGLVSAYIGLGKHVVLALSARAGQVFPLDSSSRTIIPRRFFLGGASTLRGFGEDQLIQEDVRPVLAAEARQCATSVTGVGCTDRGRRVAAGEQPVSEGGEAYMLGKAELRLPLSGRFELGMFVDAGNLWLDPKRVNPRILRPCAGLGARFVTPIGPAALDFGFNLDRDSRINEVVFAPHFSIGLF